MFTVLTKGDRSRCSFDAGTLKFGDDVAVLQSNAGGREDIFWFLVLKSKVSAGVTALQIDVTVGKVPGVEQPRVGEGLGGRMCTAGCIPPCFGKAGK